MFDLDSLVRPNIRTLQPYRCARDDFKEGILLDANENTHGPALASVLDHELRLDLNRYPDPHQVDLKAQICDFRNKADGKLTPANLCLGVGSDESIDMLLRCVCTPSKDKLLICPPTYGMYSICATVNDVDIVKVPLTTPDFQLDTKAVLNTVTDDKNIKLIYLTSPGNPTAALLNVDSVRHLAEKAQSVWNGLVVVDEAYIDFAEGQPSMSTLVTELPNLVVLQTLSKSFGLAGIRLGVTFANDGLSRYLNAMKYPYNISSLTAEVALRSTSKDGLKVMVDYVDEIRRQREVVLRELQKLPRVGKNIGGLESNFLLLQILNEQGEPSNEAAEKLYTTLAVENGVVVRFRGKELNCTGALRISIGTARENEILVARFALCLAMD